MDWLAVRGHPRWNTAHHDGAAASADGWQTLC
jgi:hypothetical protein